MASVQKQACVSRAAARRLRRVVAGGEGGHLMVRGRGVERVRIGRRAASCWQRATCAQGLRHRGRQQEPSTDSLRAYYSWGCFGVNLIYLRDFLFS